MGLCTKSTTFLLNLPPLDFDTRNIYECKCFDALRPTSLCAGMTKKNKITNIELRRFIENSITAAVYLHSLSIISIELSIFYSSKKKYNEEYQTINKP